jgi:hypothetical protein
MPGLRRKFTGSNIIKPSGFYSEPERSPQFNPSARVSVKVDGRTFTSAHRCHFIFKRRRSWINQKFTPGLFSKQNGAEGPLSEGISSNHVYVYGTQGGPSPEELQARQAIAYYAADWAYYRAGPIGRVMIFPRALADGDVRQSDFEISNLVLFGTAKTNSLIQKYADRLPVQLNEGVSDYGLVYIYPVNGHYVLINSGLPWWTPPASGQGQQGGGLSMISGRGSLLNGFGDFILFKGSPDNVIWQGNFDNNWELPAEAVTKLKASGVLTVK